MKRIVFVIVSVFIFLTSIQLQVNAVTPESISSIDLRDDFYYEACEAVGIERMTCWTEYIEKKILPEPITAEMVEACNTDAIWVWAGDFKKCIEEQLEARKDEGELPLHPFIEGFLSNNETTRELEKKEHFVNYYFDYINNPWYSDAWFSDLGKQIGAIFLVGIPSVISNILDMIKIAGTTILMYFIKFTSSDFLTSIIKDSVQSIYDYFFVDGNSGIMIIGIVTMIGIVSAVLKLRGKWSFRFIGRTVLHGVIMAIVVFYTATSIFTISELAHKYVDPLVAQVFNLDDQDSELLLKKQVFILMVQQPYLIRNFGNGSYADLEKIENEKGYEETFEQRLINILNDKDGAVKKEIETYKNPMITNSPAKAWLNLLVSLLSFINGIMFFIIIMLLLLPVALVTLVTAMRPAYILFDLIFVLKSLDFAKLFRRLGYLFLWGAIVTIINLTVVSLLVTLGEFVTDLAAYNYFFTLIFDAVLLVLLYILIKFRDMWLPQAKALLSGAGALFASRKDIDSSPLSTAKDVVSNAKSTFSKEAKALEKSKSEEDKEEKKPIIIDGEFTEVGSYSQEQEDLLKQDQLLLSTTATSGTEVKGEDEMKPASDKQMNYLNSLLNGKDYDESDARIQALLQGEYSMQQASDAISYLKNQPDKNTAKPKLSEEDYQPKYSSSDGNADIDISDEELERILNNLPENQRRKEQASEAMPEAEFAVSNVDPVDELFQNDSYSDEDIPPEFDNSNIDYSEFLDTLNNGK